MLLEISGEITPERMNGWSQSKNNTVVDVTGDRSKIRCCKEQCCIGTWNVRSMNQGKLEVVKQEMARVNVDILRISELKWTGMGEFNSDDHYIHNSVLFLLWLHPFILSGVISLLISSSILSTARHLGMRSQVGLRKHHYEQS